MAPEARVDGDSIVISGLERAPELKELGARWQPDTRTWRAPATRSTATAIVDAKLGLPDLRDALMPSYAPIRDARLYEYQRDAAGRLIAAPHGLLLSLSPGLGKTAVAVVAADKLHPAEQIVVVAPASLLDTWKREIMKWSKLVSESGVYIMRGTIDFDRANEARWLLVSWDRVAKDPEVWGTGWPLWILDESVLTKSRASKRFKALQRLRKGVERLWLLSGSPTTRYADDLWAQLNLLWPRAFPSYWRFAERYAVVEDTPWGRKVTGTRAGRDAAEENSDLILTVGQDDVLDLPEYLFESIDVKLRGSQAREYARMHKEFVAELKGEQVIAANEIARLQKLQQITSWWDGSAKHDALVEMIESYEPPHLIWTHWREGADSLTQRIRKLGIQTTHVHGGMQPAQRDAAIEAFKSGDEAEALVLSIGVGKFGHTLTNAKTVWYVDKTWNADDYFQSLHRVRRIGLEHRPVVVTLRAPGTVDELVEANLGAKMVGIGRLTRSDLRELLAALGRNE